MINHNKDKELEAKWLSNLKERELEFLWACLFRERLIILNENQDPPIHEKRNGISNLIANSNPGRIKKRYIELFEKFIIEQEFFDWIGEKDYRLITWILDKLHCNYIRQESINMAISHNKSLPYTIKKISPSLILKGKKEIISAFDYSTLTKAEKLSYLDHMKESWSNIISNDKIRKFIDKDGRDKIEWCYDYIKKNSKNNSIKTSPQDSEEYRYYILYFFDSFTGHPAEKEVFFDKMKKSWSQFKFRAGLKGKKQCNFILSDKAKKKLESIAYHEGKRTSIALEKIIDEAYDKILK